MDGKKLYKLSRQLERMRLAPQKAATLEKLAKQLGRKKVKRGKEPVWVSDLDVDPLSIPHHGGRDLAPGTKNSILAQLEEDIVALEKKLGLDGHTDVEGGEQ